MQSLRWLLYKAWLLLVTVIILAAVGTVTMRIIASNVQHYRQDIERLLTAKFDYPVRFSNLGIYWHGISPRLVFEGVRILDARRKTVWLQINRAVFGISLLDSAWSRHWKINRIALNGVRLQIITTQNGRILQPALSWVSLDQGQRLSPMLDWFAPGMSADIEQGEVVVEDRGADKRYTFPELSAQMRVGHQGRIKVAALLKFAQGSGRKLIFLGKFNKLTSHSQEWNGLMYWDLQGIHLPPLLLKPFIPKVLQMSGRLSMRIWGSLRGGRFQQFVGHLNLVNFSLVSKRKARISGGGGSDRFEPVNLAFEFGLRHQPQGWLLQADRIKVGTKKGRWSAFALSVAEQDIPLGRQITGWVSHLILPDLLPFVATLPQLPLNWRKSLQGLSPAGILSNVRFQGILRKGQIHELTMSSRFAGFSIRPYENYPGIRGGRGTFWFTPQGGALSLKSPDFIIIVPKWFTRPLPAMNVRLPLRWRLVSQGVHIRSDNFGLANANLKIQGNINFLLPSKAPPYLDLRLFMPRGNLAGLHHFLPFKPFSRGFNHWLETALKAGEIKNGQMLIQGNPRNFPFRQHQGIFSIRLPIVGAVVKYYHDWPPLKKADGELVFKSPGLDVTATTGEVLSTHIDTVNAQIPDVEKAVLHLRLRAHGPVPDLVAYLAHTSVADGYQDLFKKIITRGSERLSTQMLIPLDENNEKGLKIKGETRIRQGDFTFIGQNFKLREINGAFTFTQSGVRATNVTAIFRGSPTQLSAAIKVGGSARVSLSGRYRMSLLLPKSSPLRPFVQGVAPMRIEFAVPLTTRAFRKTGVKVHVQSNLKGVVVDLPQPIGKSAALARRLNLRFAVDKPGTPIWVEYGPALRLVLRLAGKRGCRYPQAMDIRYNAGMPRLPLAGIRLEGQFENLNLDAWRDVRFSPKQPVVVTNTTCPDSVMDDLQRIRQVHVTAHYLQIFSLGLDQVKLTAQGEPPGWNMDIESRQLAGRFWIPFILRGPNPVRFKMSRLILGVKQLRSGPLSAQGRKVGLINPAAIPPLEGQIQQMEIAGVKLAHVRIRTQPLSDGLKIQGISLVEPAFTANIHGEWLKRNQSTFTRLWLNLNIQNAGQMLELFKFPGMSGGQGQAKWRLSWPGAPNELHWKTIRGSGSVSLRNGRLNHVNTGPVGKLLTLFNLNELPNHLARGFSGLFKSGFGFNILSGNFRVEDGIIETRDLHLDGSTADIHAKGKINVFSDALNVDVTAIPQLQSALPIASALVGGPVAGLAVYLFDRFSGLGKRFNKIFKIEYHVGGTSKAPVITLKNKIPQTSNHEASGASLY